MSEAVVLTLTKVRTELGAFALEQHIADALSLPQSKVTVMIDEEGCAATIVAYPAYKDDISSDAESIATRLNDAIRRGDAGAWAACARGAMCEVADDEESVFIEEEEALDMWREMSEEARTGHLGNVPNPDGVMIRPTHRSQKLPTMTTMDNNCSSPTESQLRRDPTLLEYDNVKRVDVAQIYDTSWEEPFVITNAISDEILENGRMLNKDRLATAWGEVEVRTGNRETLIDNGITNSKPMSLSDALAVPQSGGDGYSLGCGCIVFSPVKELPNDFANELKSFTDSFPGNDTEWSMKKFTLTLASEGFGIGMHKHKAAMFMLLIGRKKWYMSSSENLESGQTTHPAFYGEKSSHKCIQKPGEILFVPNEWYHEIFNLEYTGGIQALPE